MRLVIVAALAGLAPAGALAQQAEPAPTDVLSDTAAAPDAPAGGAAADGKAPEQAAEAPPPAPEDWAVHGQGVFLEQAHPAFRSPYVGPHSLTPAAIGDEALTLTLFGGVRLWDGAEVWANPEILQGYGLSDSYGAAGYPNGVTNKIGSNGPYIRLQRLFLRQTIALGGEEVTLAPQANQLGGTTTNDRIVVTVGKFTVTDIFDTNKYAHDPRADFLNWAVTDGGWFDFGADAWGYTYGAAAEWYQGRWALRGGVVDTPTTPGYKYLDPVFISQFQMLGEIEERHEIAGQPGAVRVTGFLSRQNLGLYKDAVAKTLATGDVTQASEVLQYRSRGGGGLNVEQQVAPDVGVFLRAGMASGESQVGSFTDIDKSISGGVSIMGTSWSRPDDTVGAALVWNTISRQAKDYLNSGGLGLTIGDGQLPSSGPEGIFETYYKFVPYSWGNLTADYQFINNPAYNRQRGPVSVFALRLQAAF